MGKTSFGFVEEGKVIRKAFAAFDDRVIGEVNSTEEEAIKYFEERYQKLEKEVNEIAAKIESQANKGSFLTKVEFLKSSLPDYDGLGDFEALSKQLDQMLAELNQYIEQNRHKNLQIKTALLEQLKPIAESHEWKTATAQIKEIQQKWIKTGAVAEEKREEIEQSYQSLIEGFYARRASFYEDLNQMMEEREADYREFVEQAKSLLEIKDLEQLRKTIRSKQEEWKSLGKIKASAHSSYWAEFQAVIKRALTQAKKNEQKVSGGNSKEQLEKLKSLLADLHKANEGVLPKAEVKPLKEKWRLLQKIKHKEASAIKNEIRFQLDMLSEKLFINTLVSKRKADPNDLRLRQKISRDLLERDKRELNTFEENLGKFNMADGLDNMLTKKLKQQEQKVEVKKAILSQIKDHIK